MPYWLHEHPICIIRYAPLDMENGFFALALFSWLLTGCSHFSNSTYGRPTNKHEIACDDTPANQPGCYNRQYQEGILNKLLDSLS